ncbi:SDR family NAD(P)-dependent oxidoreductase [Actinoplanes palleronii]|uniref:Short-chain dehydrogenase n=1 Tax=Actinoplanes palleronii TaxID=113570 RepID=A0ABQ4BMY8_9ACTN|nr:SDR family NAD(P)-dependent oxidoreductase [Actinoplanes palleronii]GIE72046.1 short-chain dehydrogenase [Actinoplanes palleronii]
MTTSYQTAQLAIVTGASTGIGRATAERLAADGFHVLAGVRKQADAQKIAAPGIEPVILDITNDDHIASLLDRVTRDPDGRPLRVLVNNAGVAVNAPVEVLSIEDWRYQFDVSVFGQIALTRALLPLLLASHGRIVNVTSVGGRVAMANFGAYSAAKFAMEAVSDSLRREVEAFGVTVVKITPGAVSTNLTESGLAAAARITDTMTADQRERYDELGRAFTAQAKAFARDGVSPERAAAVISKAVAAGRPKTRYTIGRDGAMFTFMPRIASDRLLDSMLRMQNKRLAKTKG